MRDERGEAGAGYAFITPVGQYELEIEERDDPYDRFCVSSSGPDGYDEWLSDSDLRGAIGVAVMRIIRHETRTDCLCQQCRAKLDGMAP